MLTLLVNSVTEAIHCSLAGGKKESKQINDLDSASAPAKHSPGGRSPAGSGPTTHTGHLKRILLQACESSQWEHWDTQQQQPAGLLQHALEIADPDTTVES